MCWALIKHWLSSPKKKRKKNFALDCLTNTNTMLATNIAAIWILANSWSLLRQIASNITWWHTHRVGYPTTNAFYTYDSVRKYRYFHIYCGPHVYKTWSKSPMQQAWVVGDPTLCTFHTSCHCIVAQIMVQLDLALLVTSIIVWLTVAQNRLSFKWSISQVSL